MTVHACTCDCRVVVNILTNICIIGLGIGVAVLMVTAIVLFSYFISVQTKILSK